MKRSSPLVLLVILGRQSQEDPLTTPPEAALTPRQEAELALIGRLREISPQWAADTIHLYSPSDDRPSGPMPGRWVGADRDAYFHPYYDGFIGLDGAEHSPVGCAAAV
jgi:hypothetical protein